MAQIIRKKKLNVQKQSSSTERLWRKRKKEENETGEEFVKRYHLWGKFVRG